MTMRSLFSILLLSALTVTSATAQTDETHTTQRGTSSSRTVKLSELVDPQYEDDLTPTPRQNVESEENLLGPRRYYLQTLTRSYADRIAVRWAPEDFVSWYLSRRDGYRVLRILQSQKEQSIDTLDVVRPYTREQFEAHFDMQTDTLAGAAYQLVYGKISTPSTTQPSDGSPGSSASILDVYEEQQTLFGYAMLLAEQRADLAIAMGLRYDDRSAQPGQSYEYVVRTLAPDSVLSMGTVMASAQPLGSWKPEVYRPLLADSLNVNSVLLFWPSDNYSSFNIERRTLSGQYGSTEWKQLNAAPYVPMSQIDGGYDQRNLFADQQIEPGTYQYRISAYDAFADLTHPSQPYTVVVPDLTGVIPPVIDRFDVYRDEQQRPILCTVTFHKDSLEADLAGYRPYYRNPKLGDVWLPMLEELLPKEATEASFPLRGLETGDVYMAAVDTAGNVSYSLPQTLRIADLVPPEAPTQLRSYTTPQGEVYIEWTPSADRDIMYYEVYRANDPRQNFYQLAYGADTAYIDTLSLQVSEPFAYYFVKALDYSGNYSQPSDTLKVERPNLTPPLPCRIDSMRQDEYGIYMSWIVSNEPDVASHTLYRRLEGQKDWERVKTYGADQAVGERLHITDCPPLDDDRRYHYVMETRNRTGISSGKSLDAAILHPRPLLLPVTIHVEGVWREDQQQVILTWHLDKLTDDVRSNAYLVVLRRLEGEETFSSLMSISVGEMLFTDKTLQPGQKAEYCLRLRTRDGRFSKPSEPCLISR